MTRWKRLRRAVKALWKALPGEVIAAAGTAVVVYLLLRSVMLAIAIFVGTAGPALADRYRGEQVQSVARRAEYIIPLTVFVVALILARDVEAPPAFFRVSAQVIMILVLTVALQTRILDMSARHGHEVWMALIIFAFLCVGEFESLRALILERRADATMPIAAIAAGLAGVLVGAMAGPGRGDPQ